MSTPPSPRYVLGRSIRLAVFVVVTILSVCPALICATRPLVELKPSGIRLSRGFELPPTKGCAARPTQTVVAVIDRTSEPKLRRTIRRTPEFASLSPFSVLYCSPDPLRGPPPTRLS